MIDVVLLQPVPGIGQAGDRVRVKDGYALNYLVPRGLGAMAGSADAARAVSKERRKDEERTRATEELQRTIQSIEAKVVDITAKVGHGNKLYGSVTSGDIAEKLGIDKKYIHLDQPLKTVGEHSVLVRLTENQSAHVTVRVAPLAIKQ